MENTGQYKGIEELLALRGKITPEYDWEQEEADELKAAEERMLCDGSNGVSHHEGNRAD